MKIILWQLNLARCQQWHLLMPFPHTHQELQHTKSIKAPCFLYNNNLLAHHVSTQQEPILKPLLLGFILEACIECGQIPHNLLAFIFGVNIMLHTGLKTCQTSLQSHGANTPHLPSRIDTTDNKNIIQYLK